MFAERSQLGDLVPVSGGKAGSGIDPISAGIGAAMTLFQAFAAQKKNNALKVIATKEAEGFVRAFWGLSGNCDLPPQGLAIAPGGHNFCSQSIAGMIESCDLDMAQSFLSWLASMMQAAAVGNTEQAGKFSAWVFQYGMGSVMTLQQKIHEAASICPKITAPLDTNSMTGQIVTTESSGTMEYLGVAALFLFFVFMMRRRSAKRE